MRLQDDLNLKITALKVENQYYLISPHNIYLESKGCQTEKLTIINSTLSKEENLTYLSVTLDRQINLNKHVGVSHVHKIRMGDIIKG